MNQYTEIATKPIFFERNRVFRVYKGGKLFHDFFQDEAIDGNYPEEWIASSVKALNKESSSPNEGISKIQDTSLYFDELLQKERALLLGERKTFDILVKVLDSAIRLPMQAHPDKDFSKKNFRSNYGKAEAWLVLATRENAKIYFGFKNQISKEDFSKIIEDTKTDKNIMTALVNEIPVNKGDVCFITSKIVHAIGAGCLILEVQEPTDFTIQPEWWCGEYKLNEFEMFLGLAKEKALECFDYSEYGLDILKKGLKKPILLEKNDHLTAEALIRYVDTPCFAINRYRVSKGAMTLPNAPGVYIVTEGDGLLVKEGYKKGLEKGDYFFMPYSLKKQCEIQTITGIEIIECLPSKD